MKCELTGTEHIALMLLFTLFFLEGFLACLAIMKVRGDNNSILNNNHKSKKKVNHE